MIIFDPKKSKGVNMRYIVALDEGTTSVRSVLFDTQTNSIKNIEKKRFKQIFPKSGWVEHDANVIWRKQKETLLTLTQDISPKDIFGICITNQRETIVAWNKKTGRPICNAIVWQCRRTADLCRKLAKDKNLCKTIKQKTGLLPDAYFSGTKIKWILDNIPEAKKLLDEDNLLVGTIDSYLIYRLTEGKVHATDATNASRTMLFNINTYEWDDELLELFNIPKSILPKVLNSCEDFGTTNILGYPIKITGVAGDQQASLFGQGCFEKGDIKNTYGTGCFILQNIGDKPIICSKGLLTTVACSIDDKKAYAIEGSIFNAGSTLDWFLKEFRVVRNHERINAQIEKVGDNGGVYLVPAFTGIGAPYWDMDARAIITGLSRGSSLPHICRAVYESMAFSTYDVMKLIKKESGITLSTLKADGGVSTNDFMLGFQADLLGTKVVRSHKESTCLGVIYLCGLSLGVYKNLEEIKTIIKTFGEFNPTRDKNLTKKYIAGWNKAVRQCLKK